MATSDHMKILEAALVRIKALDLTGVADADVVIGKFHPARDNTMDNCPGVILSPSGVEQAVGIDSESNEMDYPIVCYMVDEDIDENEADATQIAAIDKRLLWRERIRKVMLHKPNQLISAGAPSGCCDIVMMSAGVGNQTVVDPIRWAVQNLWVGVIGFRAKISKVR